MKIGHKKKLVATTDYKLLAFTLFTVSFFSFFTVRPSLKIIATLYKERQEYERVNQVLETKITQVIQAQTNYMQALAKKKLLDETVPPDSQLEDTAHLLNSVSDLSTVNIDRVIIHPKQQVGLATIAINISGAGNFDQLIEFINTTYQSTRLFYLKEIALEKAEGTSSAAIKFNSNIETYYYLE